MQRYGRVSVLLALLLAISVAVFPSGSAYAEPEAPLATVDDEIALIEYPSGRIRIDDPSQPAGIAPFTWNSGSEIGWGFVAAGDFNGDGDAELAAVRGGDLRVFDPKVQPGFPEVSFLNTLSGGRAYRLIATGDIDRDGRDELVVTHTESSGQTLQVWDGGGTGTSWGVVRSETFSGAWDAVATGDMNNDGYDDVALFRNVDQRIKIYNGATWTPPLAETTRDFDWLAMTLGNFTNSYPGDEIALTREDVGCGSSQLNSLVMFRLGTVGLVNYPDPQPDWRYCRYFKSLASGDVNGDGDDELMMLRDPEVNSVSVKLINPSGSGIEFETAIGYGSSAWSQIRMGDLDGDGRDETVVLRQDRYRMYWQIENLSDQNLYTDAPGSFRTPSLAVDYDRPTMAIANYDGQGEIANSPLVVTPLEINIIHRAGGPLSTATVSIDRLGAATGWTAGLFSGSLPGLQIVPSSGTTPSTMTIGILSNNVGNYSGQIRVQANDPAVPQGTQYVQVNVRVVNRAVFLPFIAR
jgi:hypothetical protein